MPTSRSKNFLYRCLLPAAPRVPGNPIISEAGHPLSFRRDLVRVIRRHHVSGGALFFSAGSASASVFTSCFHTEDLPDSETMYRVASVTKMATALLAYILQEKGLIDLSAPVTEYLPDSGHVSELKGITFSHLLSHTSGLSDPPNLETLLKQRRPFTEAVSGRRLHEPGSVFMYSNLGFGLIGSAFEFALDLPLGDIYQQYLFAPLGMKATLEGCTLPADIIMPVVRLMPYRPDQSIRVTAAGKTPLESPDPMVHYGHSAGSMYTDLSSMAALLQCIRDGGKPLMSSPCGMRTKAASYGKVSPTLSYGSGLLIIQDARLSSGPICGHQGFAYGCVDGAFWEEKSGHMVVSLNGSCSEARKGRLGLINHDICKYAFGKELPSWT